jgi:hypothetical protein
VQIYDRDRPCWVDRTGSDQREQMGLVVQRSSNVLIEDSYVGYMETLGSMSNTRDVVIRRTRFQHWSEHGFKMRKGTSNVLIENVIWGGTTWGHCWDGDLPESSVAERAAKQATLTDRRCRVDSECADQGAANVCRVDDCFCTRTTAAGAEPPYCGTCPEGGAKDECWRGPRSLDVYEVDGLTVRNNTFVGHGYELINSVHRNFEANEARKACSTYPGVCELGTDRSCTKLQGDAFCKGLDLGRCLPICEVRDYKFYNNIVYDLVSPGMGLNLPSYVRVPTENAWNHSSNVLLDGNLYSGGSKRWWGCAPDFVDVTRFGPSEGSPNWQESICTGARPDPNSHWLPDIEASFAGYATESYQPAGSDAAMVDAGISGICAAGSRDGGRCRVDSDCPEGACRLTDPDGVAYCAGEDFTGAPRTDGACDVGAFELGAPPDGP